MGFLLLSAEPDAEGPGYRMSEEWRAAKRRTLKEARQGSAEAHFQLFYRFNLPEDQDRFHLLEAARAGHPEAMASAFDVFLFRAVSRGPADPRGVWALYEKALRTNPDLMEEPGAPSEEYVDTARLCAELPPFDLEAFLEKHGLRKPRGHHPYWLWEIAEEASRHGRFGPPDPERTLQLIVHGGAVPGELMAAVGPFHAHWKADRVVPFDLCDFITSGGGATYCANRAARTVERKREAFLGKLAGDIGENGPERVAAAGKSADAYFLARAAHEIGTTAGGAWYGFRLKETRRELRAEWVFLLKRIAAGNTPQPSSGAWPTERDVEREQAETVRWMEENKDRIDGWGLSAEGSRKTAEAWAAYRKDFVALCGALRPEVEAEAWNGWLRSRRIRALSHCRWNIDAYFPREEK